MSGKRNRAESGGARTCESSDHYLTRFGEELDRRGDYISSMYRTLQSAGRAIVLTTSMLIAGFLVFLSSDFKATHDLGLLNGSRVED